LNTQTIALCLLVASVVAVSACAQTPEPEPVVQPTVAAPVPVVIDEPAPTEAPMLAEGELPMVDPAMVTGDIVTAGSSTVFPLAEKLAERFREDGYTGNITVDSIGSGAGIERFCDAAESDIANASRAIEDEEVELCRSNGREPVEFRVGTDALAVVVSAENDFVDNLTLDQVRAVFSTATTWADVDPAWPAEPIQRFIPGTDSGTFDYFVEVIFDKDSAPMVGTDPQMSEDDNVLVTGVQGSPYAISFFGYAYYEENAGSLKALWIDGVEPSAATVDDGTYTPLARPLFLYSTAEIMQSKPQVAAYLNYFLTNLNDVIVEVGYFPSSDEALAGAKANWLAAVGP